MDPSEIENGSLTLGDAIRDSLTEGNEAITPAGDGAPAQGLIPPEPEWEAPAWTQRWKPEARDALGRFAKNTELKQYYEPLRAQMEDTNAYITRRDQEYADYRKRLDPLYEAVRPFEQRYALNGVPLHQGVQQLFQAAELLNTDPDQAFPWLAGSNRPRDPQAVINLLARSWGIDLGQMSVEAPYVDPQVQALMQELHQLRGGFSQVQQHLTQQQEMVVQQQQHALVAEISDFEAAKDDNGQPLHPHFGAVFDDMVLLVQTGRAKDLPGAYKEAVRLNPQLTAGEQAEKARKKALEEAAARTQAAEKSENASKTVVGKGRTSGKRESLSFRDGYDQAREQLGS